MDTFLKLLGDSAQYSAWLWSMLRGNSTPALKFFLFEEGGLWTETLFSQSQTTVTSTQPLLSSWGFRCTGCSVTTQTFQQWHWFSTASFEGWTECNMTKCHGSLGADILKAEFLPTHQLVYLTCVAHLLGPFNWLFSAPLWFSRSLPVWVFNSNVFLNNA